MAPALLALCLSCYDPAVHDRVMVALDASGAAQVTVTTFFKKGDLTKGELPEKDRDEIQRVLDRYALGRDVWLAGFERAGGRAVTHRLEGSESRPEAIVREAALDGVESLVAAMPDAIANIRLMAGDEPGRVVMQFIHIDVPEPVRVHRRRIQREIAAWSETFFTLSSRQCDLYDYLAVHPDRRRAAVGALVEPERIDEMLDPRETALVRGVLDGVEAMAAFSAAQERDDEREPPVIAGMSFSAFEPDFCVTLPEGAADVTASAGLQKSTEAADRETWCFERLATDDLLERVAPESDPPLSALEAGVPIASFSCRRYDDEAGVEARVWETILPRPVYELAWRQVTAPASGP